MKKILILGGGFAGVEAAIKLQKTKKFDVTLVSDRDYLFLYPISIWVPVRTLDFEDAKLPLSKIQKKHGFKLITEKVKSIQAAENKVELQSQTLQYDYLIVAFGAGKMQPKGVEFTGTICGQPDQTLAYRNKLDALIAKGHTVIIIEHNLEVIKCADHIIDIGPEGGNKGGNLVFEGTPEEILKCKDSYTGKFLKDKM